MREFFKTIEVSDEFMEYFTGFMLGDGFLSNRNKSKHSSQFIVTNKFTAHADFVSAMLEREGIDYMKKYRDKHGGFKGSTASSTVYTKFYKTFADLESVWYAQRDDGTHYKIVPPDIKLTPKVLLTWFIGDGFLNRLHGNPVRAVFCTDRYTDDEIRFLRDCFERDTGIPIQIDWYRRRLRIPKRHLNDFYAILPKCPEMIYDDLGYKWA